MADDRAEEINRLEDGAGWKLGWLEVPEMARGADPAVCTAGIDPSSVCL